MRNFILVAFLFVLIFTTVSCSNSGPKLTEQEVYQYIEEHNINKVDIEAIEETYVVLFKEQSTAGYHLLYKNKDNHIQDQMLFSSRTISNTLHIAGSSTRLPFVTVIINDENIKKKSKIVEVNFQDGKIVKKELVGDGVIIPYGEVTKGNISYSNIIVYDEEENVIYSLRGE
ncbi:hypothetical protein M6D81_30635 [Paenibacillus sp. J5C_2022]|uniref:hypothetical protein n=1 Tax=Paenibacillus sp. J5C2022 TaxID=2977129 RepID=UPI0021D30D5B|nr:hypothetical protein [Paenibacillus sp. J5C2022]MCU6713065.1 hypothetical protein [Paenibacillus sp. J5C2022]